MRFVELLRENEIYNDLIASLDSILISAKSNGLTELKTDDVVVQLNSEVPGQSIDPATVVSLLQNNPGVTQSNTTVITLAAIGQQTSSGDADDSVDKVKKLAATSASAAMKRGS